MHITSFSFLTIYQPISAGLQQLNIGLVEHLENDQTKEVMSVKYRIITKISS